MLRFVIFNVNDHKNSFKPLVSSCLRRLFVSNFHLRSMVWVIHECKNEKLPFRIGWEWTEMMFRTSHTALPRNGKKNSLITSLASGSGTK